MALARVAGSTEGLSRCDGSPGQVCSGAGVVCDPVDDLLAQRDRRPAGPPGRLHLAAGARDQQLADRFGLVLAGERVRRQVKQCLETAARTYPFRGF